MLHGENDSMNNCLEHLSLQLEHTRGAMIYDVMNELEKWFSEVWVIIKVVHDHVKSWLAETLEDVFKELGHIVSLLFNNGGEQKKNFWVTSFRNRLLVVLNHDLESWQELLIEECEISLFLDVDLDKFEYLSSNRLHRLDQTIIP